MTMAVLEEDWQRYRRMRWQFLLVWVGGIPSIWLMNVLVTGRLPAAVAELLNAVLLVALFIAFLGMAIRLQLLRCPRCKEHFSTNGFVQHSILARKCIHCGLKKFSLD